MLEVTCDGKTSKIGTSMAAARYVARYTKQYGSTPLEEALIDGVVDVSNDIREEAITVHFTKGDTEKVKNFMVDVERIFHLKLISHVLV